LVVHAGTDLAFAVVKLWFSILLIFLSSLSRSELSETSQHLQTAEGLVSMIRKVCHTPGATFR
jgi:hypothetical protein